VRAQPGNPWALDALAYWLLEAGYLREALGIIERWVEIDPLSPVAHGRLFDALYAVGRTDEAVATIELSNQLGATSAKVELARVYLLEGRDEAAIANIEARLRQLDDDPTWVRELVASARDPVTGQAYLDRRIPQIVASVPDGDAYAWQQGLTGYYLYFGFLDRYFELILDLDLTDSAWTDADIPVYQGTVWRRLGFTAHPKYLEVAESMGIIDVWEQRGPPDFCIKSSGQWVCE
jgi:tetratricopeptide (TPR) repeat protein